MDTEITKKNLYSTLGEIVRDNYYADEMDFTRINNEVEELMRNAEACEYLINNRRKLNDEEFYLVLSSFLDLYFNEFDYYHILELVNGKKYVGIFNMPTTMAVSIDLTERTKDTFKFWNQDMQIYYKVLYTKEFKRDAYHIYNK